MGDLGWSKNHFIARLEYQSLGLSARHFVKFLIANFQVEEYLEMMNDRNSTPVGILESFHTTQLKCLNN